MSPLVHHVFTWACNNAWANHRLLEACGRLSRQELVATRTNFFPSIQSTLNHILTVDWYYVDALERAMAGEPVNRDALRFFEPEEPFDEWMPLSVEQHAVDRRLIELCRALTDEQLALEVPIQRSTKVQHEKASRVLSHLFEHQIHHRGQVHAMLAGTSVRPPQLDEFFCANDAHLRAAELAAIGLTEESIWGA